MSVLSRSRSRSRSTHRQAKKLAAKSARTLQIESLEDRRVMACDVYKTLAGELGDQLQEIQGIVKDAIQFGQDLPLVGDKIGSLWKFADTFAPTMVQNLTDAAEDLTESQLESLIVNALGPNGPLNILGDRDGNGVINEDDIQVTIELSNDSCSASFDMDFHKDLASVSLGVAGGFNLGLPALPFDVHTNVDLVAKVGFDWQHFHFTLTPDAVDFDLTFPNELALNATVELGPGSNLDADIGFLNATVTDGVVEHTEQGDITHHSKLSIGAVADLDYDNGSFLVNITTQASADVDLHVNASIDSHFPSIESDFLLHFDAFGNDASAPTVQFKNITVDLGSYVSELLSPLVDAIKDVAEPAMPIVDFVTDPIPGLSDITEELGLGQTSILSLAQLADDYIPNSYKELVQVIELVVQVLHVVDQINNSGETLKINVGDLDLSGKNGDMRNAPAAKKVSLNEKALTNLITDPAVIHNIREKLEDTDFPPVLAGAKQDILDVLDQLSNGINYHFPILDNPLGEIGRLLVGQDSNLFTVDVNLHTKSDMSLEYPLPIGISAGIEGNYKVDTFIELGYDTFGLRKFISNGRKNGDNFNGWDLVDGLWLSNESKINVDGGIGAVVSADYVVVSASVTGGLEGGLHLALPPNLPDVPDGDNDPSKVRPYSELGDCLFSADGNLGFGLSAKVRIGTDAIGIDETFDIANIEIVNFNVPCVENPFRTPVEPNLAEINEATGELTLHVGSMGSLRNAGKDENGNPIPNESFKVRPGVPNAELDPDPLPAGDIVVVSAFGQQQRFVGVKKIIAHAGDGLDQIQVLNSKDGEHALSADVELYGDGDIDTLIYEGSGKATMYGGDGDDRLTGGTGDSYLYGDGNDDILNGGTGANYLFGGAGKDQLNGGPSVNYLNGGADDDSILGGGGPNTIGQFNLNGTNYSEGGNDTLLGGTGLNLMNGGPGNDSLQAGPQADVLFGDGGNDILIAGAGSASFFGSRGDDHIVWHVGDGIPTVIDGGSDFETNTLGLFGTSANEFVAMTKEVGGNRLAISQLTNTPFLASHIQVADFEGLNGVDTVTIRSLQGTSVRDVSINTGDVLKDMKDLGDGVTDLIRVYGNITNDNATVETEVAKLKIGELDPSTEKPVPIYGGLMKISGLPTYTVHLANVNDDLRFSTLSGTDIVNVKSITGPTSILTGIGNDTINVFADNVGDLNDPFNLPDYMSQLYVDAGDGQNKLLVDQSASKTPLNVTVTSDHVNSEVLPLNYVATAGTYGGGVTIKSGEFDDHINIQNTLNQVTTSVDSGKGNDIIVAGSAAPDLSGKLAGIRGPLKIEGGQGQNNLILSDRGASTGNSTILVNPNQVLGFAGPNDNVAVSFQATQGSMGLGLIGSDVLSEKFRIANPNATLQILGGGGNDEFDVLGVTNFAGFAGGLGDDRLEVGTVTNSLAGVNAQILFFGQDGTDVANVIDSNSGASQGYTLAGNSVQRNGQGAIQFDGSLETMNLAADSFGDTMTVEAVPTTTSVTFQGGQGNDKVVGPDALNNWRITGANAGSLSDQFKFLGIENLTGGAQADAFLLSNGGSISGDIQGGGGTADRLDFSSRNSPVVFNVQSQNATNVGHWSSIELLRGGSGNDTLIGPNLPNGWMVQSLNAGILSTLALGNINFLGVESLVGGASFDGFKFDGTGSLTGQIADLGGLNDSLDYSSLSVTVVVNLNSGTATRVDGGVNGIENVTGGSSDDLLIGNSANNTLNGGDGNDIIVGNAGSDIIHGGNGRDLLIGGIGGDTISGDSGEDLIIGGRTTHDNNDAALRAILGEWTSAKPYAQRVQKIKSGVGPGNSVRLSPTSVLDDPITDELVGGGDTEWFWAKLDGPVNLQDHINDLVFGETVN